MIPVIETERLRLNQFMGEDVESILAYMSSSVIADNTLHVPDPYTENHAKEWIKKHKEENAQEEAVNWAIRLKDTGELLGSFVLLFKSKAHGWGRIGYWIGEKHWNMGYATEASTAVIKWAFENTNLNRIECDHFAFNEASGKVMKKIGMRKVGLKREYYQKKGKFIDIVEYEILKGDVST